MAKPILLYTSIFAESAIDFTTQVLDTPRTEKLKIWINTPGGSVSSGFAMLAAVQEHESENEMTVTGNADSFGFFMLLFGDNNKAYDTSNFLIHRAASFWEDFMSEEELKDIENVNKIIRKKLEARIDEDIFEKVTKKTFDDIFDMETRLDVRLTARQAKKIGLINQVIKLDVKKRAEIESRYFNDIAALAKPETNNNTNSNKMKNLFKDIFGEKEDILLAKIDDTQFVYGNLVKGAKIKATGKEEKSISGTFEADEKKITVVENGITAIENIDNKQKQIDALTEKVTLLTNSIEGLITKKTEVKVTEKDESQKQITALTEKVTSLTAVFEKAKLTKSNPKLPEGEFSGNEAPNLYEDLSSRERMEIEQSEMHEQKIKSREE